MMPVKSTFTTTRKTDPISLKEDLIRLFPSHIVTYSVMTDVFRIRNRDFSHSLQYNTDKPSKLDTVSLQLRRKRLKYNIGLFALVGIFWFLDDQLQWNVFKLGTRSDNFFFLSIFVLGLFQYIVNLIHPELKRILKVEHDEVRSHLEQQLKAK
ncbi:MAG: hypothetical protein SH808_03760 [Saprospiraceae bacterium]|nr:hypothetical protein [Saprospiraceae bacterium]MDZ4752857.1 hypothetical protein [Flavobacteriales bacterium]